MTRLDGRGGNLRADVGILKADVGTLKTDVAILKGGQARILEHMDVAELKGRVEEQPKFLQLALTSRQTRIPAA